MDAFFNPQNSTVQNKERSARQNRIYILPTRNCFILLGVLCAIAYSAVAQDSSGAYIIGFFLLGLLFVSLHHTHFMLTDLRLKSSIPITSTFAGDPIYIPLEIINPTKRPRLAVWVAVLDSFWDHQPAEKGIFLPTILADKAPTFFDLTLPTTHRGQFSVGSLAVSTVYPIGLARGIFFQNVQAKYIVYPAPIGNLPVPIPPSLNSQEIQTSITSTGEDYAGTRAYQLGDSQRHIDWRAVARGQPMLTKQFAGAGQVQVWLDWDDLNHLIDTEQKLSQLCRWLLDAEITPECSYGLRLGPTQQYFPPNRGEVHLQRCLKALALFKSDVNP